MQWHSSQAFQRTQELIDSLDLMTTGMPNTFNPLYTQTRLNRHVPKLSLPSRDLNHSSVPNMNPYSVLIWIHTASLLLFLIILNLFLFNVRAYLFFQNCYSTQEVPVQNNTCLNPIFDNKKVQFREIRPLCKIQGKRQWWTRLSKCGP